MKYLYIFIFLTFNTLAFANSSNQTTPLSDSQDVNIEDKTPLPPSSKTNDRLLSEESMLRLSEKTDKSKTLLPTLKTEQVQVIPLENTAIGKAVISGKKTDYITALNDLKIGFNVDLINILNQRTSDGKNLMELMIEAPSEKEYFAREMFHSLVTITHLKASQPAIPNNNPKLKDFQLSHISTVPINIEHLIRKANAMDNTAAYQLLQDFKQLLVLMEKQSQNQIEIMETLLRSSKHDTRWTSAGVSFLGAGILSILGYTLLFNPNEANTLLSLLLSKLPPVDVNMTTYNNPLRIAGAGAFALGLGIAVRGAKVCQKAFRKANQLKKIRQNRENNN